ncbi:hypothetical protein DACRYDRAFT_102907 [Dacryopinax primogenitus]|uniref:Beta-glucuronidase C-terminal domain-containing protein n=1 Tax=Dacryopinax primogenitus (strain DJM 731) TaxID=1858805 RepID=M5GF40_DACPD|nr:uncharacterized protein DACRYDRAFT_102907 [Dacryopinax primogenitus]EJU05947.1 hypothetical protein DACRYDRAFT_102907 [Dacryopinax primogenitus]
MLPLRLPLLLVLTFVIAQPSPSPTSTPLSLLPYPPSSTLPSIPANFLGISIELSSFTSLLASGSPLPQPFLTHLANVQSRLQAPLRLRIGGNSLDSSLYLPSQPSLLQVLPNAEKDNIPVSVGPQLFQTLAALSASLNISYTLGLPLLTPNNTDSYVPLAAAEAQLNGTLDLVLLGNEPDLYWDHGDRSGYKNYTVSDYMGDFAQEIAGIGTDFQETILGGPTVCCEWDLASLLSSGYLNFTQLKALTLQHYPQDNCFGSYAFPLQYYLSHSNVQQLSAWQEQGVLSARQVGREVRMTEFNSASCGGIPGISDTFAATLWVIDYSLQLATRGYTAAHIHTREPGVSYNVFSPPNTSYSSSLVSSPAVGSAEAATALQQLESGWSTGVTYWPLLVLAEALNPPSAANSTSTSSGLPYTAPLDLGLPDSAAGYALYTSPSWSLASLVLINYASSNVSYSLPANLSGYLPAFGNSSAGLGMRIKYLLAGDTQSVLPEISWAGQGMSPAGDGSLLGGEVVQDQLCTADTAGAGGCVVVVPGPGAALVQFGAGSAGAGGSDTGGGGGGGGGTLTLGVGAGPTTLASSGRRWAGEMGTSLGTWVFWLFVTGFGYWMIIVW